MKKIFGTLVCIVLLAVFLSAAVSAADASSFKDVKKSQWYYNAVDYVTMRGLMNGTSDTKFEPNTKMSRSMLVTVLWRYEGSPSGYVNGFYDIKDGKWFTDAVSWASENGIVTGVGSNNFDPDGNITREQLAAIFYRYTKYIGNDVSSVSNINIFPDANKVHSWAETEMKWAFSAGIISGTTNANGLTVLGPRDNATRAQVATILMRYCSNPVYNHTWDSGVKISDPTCIEKGYVRYTCLECSAVKNVAISALGHVPTDIKILRNATCTEEGEYSCYCTRCCQYVTDYIRPQGHEYEAATCVLPKHCKYCGKVSGNPLGHKYDDNGSCTVCGHYYRTVSISITNLLPAKLQYNNGGSVSQVDITNGHYVTTYYYSSTAADVKITIDGKKTADDNGTAKSPFKFKWVLIDRKGKQVGNGVMTVNNIGTGDSFTTDEIVLKGLTQGEVYILTLSNY